MNKENVKQLALDDVYPIGMFGEREFSVKRTIDAHPPYVDWWLKQKYFKLDPEAQLYLTEKLKSHYER